MMNRRNTILILTTVALLATTALAQPGQGRMRRGAGNGPDGFDGRPGPEMRLERMKAHLELTDAQVEAIEKIQDEAQADTREIRKEIARLRNQKQGEMLKDEPSVAALTDVIEQMGALRTKLQVNRMETRLAIREQLTEEQRDKMMAFGPRQGRGGRGRGDGDGPGCGGRGARGQGRGW